MKFTTESNLLAWKLFRNKKVTGEVLPEEKKQIKRAYWQVAIKEAFTIIKSEAKKILVYLSDKGKKVIKEIKPIWEVIPTFENYSKVNNLVIFWDVQMKKTFSLKPYEII